MYYSIRHITEFIYSTHITESLMEVRMQPITDDRQRCLSFRLEVNPFSQVFPYRDYLNNVVHHFDIPKRHRHLILTAESLIELKPFVQLPPTLPETSWQALDHEIMQQDFWEFLMPSQFAAPTDLLHDLMEEINITERQSDPLTLLRNLNTAIYKAFKYTPQSTTVDSPIDHALSIRQGVCQDYAHIMIAITRQLHIPCRYVSGYLYHRKDVDNDRSAEDATHAWVEAFLPELGWIGFDPTNNLIVGERHIRTAVGRDYADVPPTRGVFKGSAETVLNVGVKVYPEEKLPPAEELLSPAAGIYLEEQEAEKELAMQQQQQQQ